MALTDYLTAIGNAIRSKTGKSDLLPLSEMPGEIEDLQLRDDDLINSIIQKTAVEVHSNAVKIGSYLFSSSALVTASFPLATEVALEAFYYCPMLESISLPRAVSLGVRSLNGCSRLAFLDLPAVTSIATRGLHTCPDLRTLILRAGNVCTISSTDVLVNTPIAAGTGYAYVPAALVNSYKSATNWVTYANQIRAIEDYPEITGG